MKIFEAYAKKLEVLLSAKNKEVIAKQAEEVAKQEQVELTASEADSDEEAEEVVEDAISQAETDSQEIPASVEASEQTVYEKYKQAFNVEEFDIQV